MGFVRPILLLAALAAVCGRAKTVYLTVMFCPTYFSSRGAVVAVDTDSGTQSVVGQFEWPIGDQDECSLLVSPAVTLDRTSNLLWLDFGSDFGFNMALDLTKATVAKKFSPADPFFIQFMSFFSGKDSGLFGRHFLRGVHPTVTEKGLCNDGCYGLETLYDDDGHNITAPQLILFKAIMDDSEYHDDARKLYYAQASYDLRNETARCQAPHDSSLCMIAIDETTGAVVTSTYTNYTVYKFNQGSPSSSAVLGFIEGFPERCYQNETESSYAFGTVDLSNPASPTFIACLDTNIVMDEWISTFSSDGSEFATASGDTEANGQLLVADTQSGKVKLNADISSLGKTLGSENGLFLVLSIDYLE